MKSITGPWVSEDDLFGRDQELISLESKIRDGNDLLLTGQHRIGKTSILHELGSRLKSDGWIFHFVDAEEIDRAEEVIKGIATAIHSNKTLVSRLFKKIKSF